MAAKKGTKKPARRASAKQTRQRKKSSRVAKKAASRRNAGTNAIRKRPSRRVNGSASKAATKVPSKAGTGTARKKTASKPSRGRVARSPKTSSPRTPKQLPAVSFGISFPAAFASIQFKFAARRAHELSIERVTTKAAKNLLQSVISRAPSKTALAQTLEVTPRTLNDWAKNGVPRGQLPALQSVRAMQSEASKQAKQTLREQKTTFARAVVFAENTQGLARALAATSAEIASWKRLIAKGKPLPPHAASALFNYVKSETEARQRLIATRKKFKALMTLAKKHRLSDGSPLFTAPKAADRSREGPKTRGWTWTKLFESELTPDVIERIDVWISSLPLKLDHVSRTPFRHWQAFALTTQFLAENFKGYGPGPQQLPGALGKGITNEELGSFSTMRDVGGKVYSNKEAARDALLSELEEGTEDSMYTWIHSVSVNAFTRKTDEERRAYETAQRKKRQRKKTASKKD